MTLVITSEQEDLIRRHAESTYPNECCGVLIGDIIHNVKHVSQAISLTNSHEAGTANRFRIDPGDLLAVDRLARKLNVSVLGFYHSHPDVEPVPSEYDLAHAWELYSYLIAEVSLGKVRNLRCWTLDPEAKRFAEEKIVTAECILEISAKKAHNVE